MLLVLQPRCLALSTGLLTHSPLSLRHHPGQGGSATVDDPTPDLLDGVRLDLGRGGGRGRTTECPPSGTREESHVKRLLTDGLFRRDDQSPLYRCGDLRPFPLGT